MTITVLSNRLEDYIKSLQIQEKADKTIKAYATDIKMFIQYLNDNNITEVSKETVIDYKAALTSNNTSVSTVNRKIVSLNKYLTYIDCNDFTVKAVKVQDTNSIDNVITVAEYERLLAMALKPTGQGAKNLKPDKQLYMIMIVLANTGIRISELQYFTVDSMNEIKKNNSITVDNKGKTRQVPASKELQKLLKAYCKEENIVSGYIFGTRNNTPILNEQITRRLKKVAGYCRIRKDKVHCHSFRHLFGKTYMNEIGRIDELADILGHSSINTTRIYSKTTNKEKAKNISSLNLIK